MPPFSQPHRPFTLQNPFFSSPAASLALADKNCIAEKDEQPWAYILRVLTVQAKGLKRHPGYAAREHGKRPPMSS